MAPEFDPSVDEALMQSLKFAQTYWFAKLKLILLSFCLLL